MTGSATDAWRRAAAVGGALLLAAAAAAVAQTTEPGLGRPVPLIREPVPLPPGGAGEPARPVLPPAPDAGAPADPATIRVESLGAFDHAAVGLLAEPAGGLGEALWNGTGENLAAALLAGLPVASASPAQQDLTRRLLLTVATPPARKGGEPAADLLAVRLDRLFAAGRLEDVVALSERAGLRPESASEPAARALAQARLLLGDEAPACAVADARLAGSKDAFWQKLQTYCLAREGARARVDLNVDLLRELGVDDRPFFQLLPAVLGEKAKLEPPASPTPLHLAMLRKAGLPPGGLPDGGPPLWRAVAGLPEAENGLRLAAAEKAAAAGALPAEALAQLYRAIAFPPERHADAERVARAEPGPMANALLYQAVHAEADAEARGRLAQLALALAERQGLYLTLARVYAPVLRDLRPTEALVGLAFDVGRALVAAADADAALAWFRTAHIAAGNREPSGIAAVLELWPLLVVADPSGQVGYSEETLDTWWQVREVEGDEERFARAEALLAVLATAGRPVGEAALWRAVLAAPARLPAEGGAVAGASPLVLTALRQASEAVRTGETVLLALHALGDGGPARADLPTVLEVAAALGRVGLVAESRRLLVEALLARGF